MRNLNAVLGLSSGDAVRIRTGFAFRLAAWGPPGRRAIACGSLLLGVVGLGLFPCSASALPAPEPDARTIFQKVSPSVVLLMMEDSVGRPTSLGSGFFVRGNIIATNMHVIEGASGGYAKVIGEAGKLRIVGQVGADSRRDLVLLEVSGAPRPSLTLSGDKTVEVGDSIYAVGNPRGLEGTFSSGIVSGIRSVGEDRVIQVTAPISPGSSGGPVLSTSGQVIGVAFATFQGGQNLNFCIPVSYLSAVVNTPSAPRPLAGSVSAQGASILRTLGTPGVDSISISDFEWDEEFSEYRSGSEPFSIGISNGLAESIKNVRVLVVFSSDEGKQLDFAMIECFSTIPPRLTKRCHGSADHVTRRMTRLEWKEGYFIHSRDAGKLGGRVLDFELASD